MINFKNPPGSNIYHLQDGLVLIRSVEVAVFPLARLQLPPESVQLTLTGLALAILVLPLKVVLAIEDGELVLGLNVLDSRTSWQLGSQSWLTKLMGPTTIMQDLDVFVH